MERGVKGGKEEPAEAATARQALGSLNPSQTSEHRQRRQLGDRACAWVVVGLHIRLRAWAPIPNSETLRLSGVVCRVTPTTEVAHTA